MNNNNDSGSPLFELPKPQAELQANVAIELESINKSSSQQEVDLSHYIPEPNKQPKKMLNSYSIIMQTTYRFPEKPQRSKFMRMAQKIARESYNLSVSEQDLDEIFDHTDKAFFKLNPEGNIKKILSRPQKEWEPADAEMLQKNITALYITYFKWACHDYFKKQIAQQKRNPGITSGSVGAVNAIDEYLPILGFSQRGIEGWRSGTEKGLDLFCEELGSLSNMNSIEKEYIKFKCIHPGKREQDFKTYIQEKIQNPKMLEPDFIAYQAQVMGNLEAKTNRIVTEEDFINVFTPARISRIKDSAEGKVRGFLEL